ncbi:hypothetical protein [Winogradskyella sp. UBA3174]|uniref:hypothetical protein n=1 Tax=Winogradskyella sp. UBA3174 TaxID=1947785 RepID=UPI0025E2DD63|nr:hypothetical protein [Winogradskyella sp. UBA3174]|tara:strand:- start:6811 stop:6966 length:156 start_codon:yes stop_codon:yes gene_type:complete
MLYKARKKGYKRDTWYLITGVFKDNIISLYVDGILEASEEINGNLNYIDTY